MNKDIKIRSITPGLILLIVGLAACIGPEISDAPDEVQPLTQAPTEVPAEPFQLIQELGEYQSWDLRLGDLDNDGDLDLFAATLGKDDPKIWLNDGRGHFSPSDQHLPACARGVMGDVNGDGYLDLVVAEWRSNQPVWTDTLSVWINDGSGNFSQGDRFSVTQGTQVVVTGDLNNDGSQDLFVLGDGQNQVWINDGAGKYTQLDQDLPTGIDSAAGIGDLDGDGDLDILAGGWEGAPAIWKNDGGGYFQRSALSIRDEDLHIHGLALGDLDTDGDLDAFVTLANGDPHQVWENNGRGGFLLSQELPASLGHSVALGDLDSDGDLDAVTGHGHHANGYARIWLNDGGGYFTDSSSSLGDQFAGAVVLGDLDGDQDLDIISAQSDWGEEVSPPDLVWKNN